MVRKTTILRIALAGVGLFLSTQHLSAETDSLSFASFTQQQSGQLAFTLTNTLTEDGWSATFSSIKTPIWFNIDQDAPTTAAGSGIAGQTIDAYLWLSSSTTAGAYIDPMHNKQLDQPFTGLTTITIQSKEDFANHSDYYLLNASFIGYMVGTVNGTASTEFNSTDVMYTSYYLNMDGATNGTLGLPFRKITPKYYVGANGLIADFTAAAGISDFSAQFVPEPQTFVLLTTGLLSLGWKVRRRSKT